MGRAKADGVPGGSPAMPSRLRSIQDDTLIWRSKPYNNFAGIHQNQEGFFRFDVNQENPHYPFPDNNAGSVQVGPMVFLGDKLRIRYGKVHFFSWAIGGTGIVDQSDGSQVWDPDQSNSLLNYMIQDFRRMIAYVVDQGYIPNFLFACRFQGETDATFCANNPGLYIASLRRIYDVLRNEFNIRIPLYIVPPVLSENPYINTEMHEYCSTPSNNAFMAFLSLQELAPLEDLTVDGTHVEANIQELIGNRLACMHLNHALLPLYTNAPILSNVVLSGGTAIGNTASISFDFSHSDSLPQGRVEVDWYTGTQAELATGGLKDLTPVASTLTYTPQAADSGAFLAARIRVAVDDNGEDVFSRYHYVITAQPIPAQAVFNGTTQLINWGALGISPKTASSKSTLMFTDHDYALLKLEYPELRNSAVVRPAQDLYIRPDTGGQMPNSGLPHTPVLASIQGVSDQPESVANTSDPNTYGAPSVDSGPYRMELTNNFGTKTDLGLSRSEFPNFQIDWNPFAQAYGRFLYFSEGIPLNQNVNWPGFPWSTALGTPSNPDGGHLAISWFQIKLQLLTLNPSYASLDLKWMGPDVGVKYDQEPVERLGIQRVPGLANDWAIFVQASGTNAGRILLFHKYRNQSTFTQVWELPAYAVHEKEAVTTLLRSDGSPLYSTGTARIFPYPNIRFYYHNLMNLLLNLGSNTSSFGETIPSGFINAGQPIEAMTNPMKQVLFYWGYKTLSLADTISGTIQSIEGEMLPSTFTIPDFALI
ncbi:MAG: hypothetical protein AAFW00_19820 [Bacteroidota bacterium]